MQGIRLSQVIATIGHIIGYLYWFFGYSAIVIIDSCFTIIGWSADLLRIDYYYLEPHFHYQLDLLMNTHQKSTISSSSETFPNVIIRTIIIIT